MMEWFKRIWHDPVVSNVIAGAILLALAKWGADLVTAGVAIVSGISATSRAMLAGVNDWLNTPFKGDGAHVLSIVLWTFVAGLFVGALVAVLRYRRFMQWTRQRPAPEQSEQQAPQRDAAPSPELDEQQMVVMRELGQLDGSGLHQTAVAHRLRVSLLRARAVCESLRARGFVFIPEGGPGPDVFLTDAGRRFVVENNLDRRRVRMPGE